MHILSPIICLYSPFQFSFENPKMKTPKEEKNMDKKIAVYMAVVVAGIGAISLASAYPGYFGGNEVMRTALENQDYEAFQAAAAERARERVTEEKFAQMSERFQAREAVHEAIQNRDYSSWVAAVEAAKPPDITQLITEENFDRFADMHEAYANGDTETAKAIAEELGLDQFPGKMAGQGCGGRMHKGFMHQNIPEV